MVTTQRKKRDVKRFLWWSVANPVVSTYLIITLFIDGGNVPTPPPGFDGGSTLARALWPEPRAALVLPPVKYSARMVRGNGGMVCLDPRPQGGDPSLVDPMEDQLTIAYAPIDDASGLWAMTRMHRCHRFEFSGAERFTPEELRLARLVFFDEVVRPFSSLSADILRRLPTQDIDEHRVLWSGYLLDAGTIALLVWLPVSFAWVGRVPAWWRQRRGRMRVQRGLCPACGYSRAGLAGACCPECGAAV